MLAVASLCALGTAALGFSGCNPDKKTPGQDVWKVGAYLSLSGAETQFGVDTKEGIELAFEEVNQAGGIKGKNVKILFEDDKTNPQEATNKVLQLIDRDKVVAILGEVSSSRSKAGGIVANKKKIPMITPSSTHPEVTQVGPFVFRVCFTDDMQGRMGAEFIVNKLGKKRIAQLFTSDDLYSSGLAHEFRQHVKRLGGEIVIEKSFLESETNFTTYITEIRDAKPDMIYAPIYYTAMVPVARQAKAAGVKGEMFVGGDGWDADTLLIDAGDELEGAYFTNHYAPDVPWPNSRQFVAKYKATTPPRCSPTPLAGPRTTPPTPSGRPSRRRPAFRGPPGRSRSTRTGTPINPSWSCRLRAKSSRITRRCTRGTRSRSLSAGGERRRSRTRSSPRGAGDMTRRGDTTWPEER
jgi:branched-chain amino acid transport system substrate-binding protein